MDADTLKVIASLVLPVAGGVRWGVLRIAKAIDDSSAANTAAAEKSSAAQLAASELFSAAMLEHAHAAQEQAVAFAELRGDVAKIADYVHEHSPVRATGSGGRAFGGT